MSEKLIPKSESVADLKARIVAIKNKLPDNYRSIIFREFPKYDSNVGSTKINNVITLRSTDLELTEILEQIASDTQSKVA